MTVLLGVGIGPGDADIPPPQVWAKNADPRGPSARRLRMSSVTCAGLEASNLLGVQESASVKTLTNSAAS